MKTPMFLLIGLLILSCNQKSEIMESYVLEVTSFKYNTSVHDGHFWAEDAKIQDIYTSKQPGFISRESGYSEDSNTVVVIVRWETMADADTSMKKFMDDPAVVKFANMIDASTMTMARYHVK